MAVAISAMMGLGRERLLARRKRGLRVRLCLCVCLFVCVSVCVLSRHESSPPCEVFRTEKDSKPDRRWSSAGQRRTRI